MCGPAPASPMISFLRAPGMLASMTLMEYLPTKSAGARVNLSFMLTGASPLGRGSSHLPERDKATRGARQYRWSRHAGSRAQPVDRGRSAERARAAERRDPLPVVAEDIAQDD